MGMSRYKSQVKLEFIQDFEMMFQRLKVDRPREAATYYTILIIDCPKEFSEILRVADDLINMTRRPLETGRSSLLRNGLIAEVLFSEDTTEFGRESYLPIHPRVIWEDVRSNLRNVVSEATLSAIETRMESYSDIYDGNFKSYGIKLKRSGNVTLRYSGKWIIYNILHNCMSHNDDLCMQIGGHRLFDESHIPYLEKFLELDNKVRLIVNEDVDPKLIGRLKNEYGDNLDIRCFHETTAGTMRNYVFGRELAVNGIKILQEHKHEPSYVGTAYVDSSEIELLSNKFDDMWSMAKPLVKEKTAR